MIINKIRIENKKLKKQKQKWNKIHNKLKLFIKIKI